MFSSFPQLNEGYSIAQTLQNNHSTRPSTNTYTMSLPTTQQSIALAGKRKPLIVTTSPVHSPQAGQVVIRVQWTASTPLDLHRADGGLLISEYPFLSGSGGAAGIIAAVSAEGDTKGLQVGDEAMSFAFYGNEQANHQEYMTVPAYLVSKVPKGIPLQAAVTVPVNLVTVFHAATKDLELELPWPRDPKWTPKQADEPILIWGASSSVGIFAIQVLRHWGYNNILAVSSGRHHDYLRELGATACFDYTGSSAVPEVNAYVAENHDGKLPYILDCIGSTHGTLKPLTHIARSGSIVAPMLPIIEKDATAEEEPEYEMDASKVLLGQWAEGVTVRGVRTHFYLDVSFPPWLMKRQAQC